MRQCHRIPIVTSVLKYSQKSNELWLWDELACLHLIWLWHCWSIPVAGKEYFAQSAPEMYLLCGNQLKISRFIFFICISEEGASDIVNSALDIQWFSDIWLTRVPIFPYLLTLNNEFQIISHLRQGHWVADGDEAIPCPVHNQHLLSN